MALRFPIAVLCLAFATAAAATSASDDAHWVDSWGAPQQIPEPANALPASDLTDATLRQVVNLSIGGSRLRVRFSNVFGTRPLTIGAAHIARPAKPGGAAITAGSDTALTFDGKASVIIPAGAQYVSDPVRFSAPQGSDIAVSLYLPQAPAQQTGHPGSRSTSFVLHGDHVGDGDMPGAHRVDHWYQLSDIEVDAPADARTIVAIGDSITDGHAATTNGNDRWPDDLAARLRADPATRDVGVINSGIGGGRVLLDGLGPNLMARFDRDTLDRSGVTSIIVLEGVNDLGVLTREHPVPAATLAAQRAQIIDGFRRIIAKAHQRGVRIYGGTIMPFGGSDYYHPDAAVDADRRAINAWISAPGHFDGVIDFARVMADPAHPDRLLPAYDLGDHLHPGPAGYAAMAQAIPLAMVAGKAAAPAPSVDPAVAITFDDLPVHGPLPKGDTRVAIMARIAKTLTEFGVPPTYGFTNGGFAADEPASIPALADWRKAGELLANHSWSHANANTVTAAAWEADVLRDEHVIAPLMRGQDWHWLRFPYLAEGDTPAKFKEIRRFLGAHHYKVAGVTMSFSDYDWNAPYARCVVKGDRAAIAGLRQSYLKAAADSLAYVEAASQRLYGRQIPYVLLMHVGAFDSHMLPDLLRLYRRNGVHFVSLAKAESDPFYKGDIDPPAGKMSSTLEAIAGARGVALPPAPQPPADLATMCT